MIVARDDHLASLGRFSSIAFTGISARANAEKPGIGLDQVYEFPRAGNARARGRTVTVVLTSPIARTQAIGAEVDPAGDLDKACASGKVRAPYEARRKNVSVWRLRTGLVTENNTI